MVRVRYAWLLVAWLVWASPAAAQPYGNGSITAISTGGNCAVVAACTAFPFANVNVVSMTLQISGTFTGTLLFEACASVDGGCTLTSTDWFTISTVKQSDGSVSTGFASVGGTNTGQFAFRNAGLMAIRVRATAWTSGTATVAAVRGYASAFGQGPFALPVTGPASGTCVTPAFTFSGDTDTGVGWLGANNAAGCAGGATIFDWNATRVLSAVPLEVAASSSHQWTGQTVLKSPADGILELLNNAGTDFSRLQFGGTTSSFPALRRTGNTLQARLADSSANAPFDAADYRTNGVLFLSATAPTVTSAGASPSITASNGSVTFRVNVGTGGTANTIVLAMPTSATGWNCNGSNITAAAANRNPTGVLLQQSSTTTAATMQYQTVGTGVALAFVASDVVQMSCIAF